MRGCAGSLSVRWRVRPPHAGSAACGRAGEGSTASPRSARAIRCGAGRSSRCSIWAAISRLWSGGSKTPVTGRKRRDRWMQRVLGVGVRRVSSSGEIERPRGELPHYHDRVALLRAKLYRWGQGSNAPAPRTRTRARARSAAPARRNVRGPRPEQGPATLSGAVGVVGRDAACLGPAESGRGRIAPPRRSPGSARDAEISEGPLNQRRTIKNDFGQVFASRTALAFVRGAAAGWSVRAVFSCCGEIVSRGRWRSQLHSRTRTTFSRRCIRRAIV